MFDRAQQTTPEPAQPFQAPAALALAGLAALAVAMGIGRFAFTPILPMMQQDAGLSVADGGWLASANYIGYLIGALSIGVLCISAAAAIRGALVLIGVVTIAMGLVHDFAWWMALRLLAGVASAWVLVCVSAWSMDKLAPLARPMLGAAVFAGVGTGIALAGMLCIAIMNAHGGSVAAWQLLGLASLLATGLVWPVFGAGSRVAAPALPAPAAAWPAGTARLVWCYGIFGFGYIIPATFLPAMARAVIADPAVFGWSWPVFGAAAAASTLAAAAWGGALGSRRLWRLGHLATAAGLILPLLWPGMTAIVIAALCVGGAFMVITMAGMQEARNAAGAQARRLIAAMTAAFAVGQIAGPLLISLLAGYHGGTTVVLALAASLLVVGERVLAQSPGTSPLPSIPTPAMTSVSSGPSTEKSA